MKNVLFKKLLFSALLICIGLSRPTLSSSQECTPATTVYPTMSATDTPKNIPDLGNTESSITVSGLSGVIRDIDVRTNLGHSRSTDLKVRLRAPSGKIITLTSGNGYGLGQINVFNGTLWDDQSDIASPYNEQLVADHPYYQNNVTATPLTPEEPLGAFIGENPNGVWKLLVDDQVPGSTFGTLHGWQISITTVSAIPASLSGQFQNNDGIEIDESTVFYSSSIDVQGMGENVSNVRVKTNIEFFNCSFLSMFLVSPSGKEIALTTRNASGFADVYNGTWWQDDAQVGNSVSDIPYQNGVAEAYLAPEEGLNNFIGEDPNGTWTLRFLHHSDGFVSGFLHGWTLDLTTCQSLVPKIGAALAMKQLQIQSTPAVGTGLVTVEAIVRNNGDEALQLSYVQLPLSGNLGTAWVGVVGDPILVGGTAQSMPMIDTAYDGAAHDLLALPGTGLLLPGETVIFQVKFLIDPDAPAASLTPSIQLAVAGLGQQTLQTAYDYSDAGNDPEGENPSAFGNQFSTDDPTRITVPVLKSSLRAISNCSETISGTEGHPDGFWELTVANLGNTTMDQLLLEDKLSELLGPGFVKTLAAQNQIVGGNALQMPVMNPDFNGTTDNFIWKGTTGRLAPRQSITLQIYTETNAFALDPNTFLYNQARIQGRAIDGSNNAIPKLDGSVGAWTYSDLTDAGSLPTSMNGNNSENDPSLLPAIAVGTPANFTVEAGDEAALQQWLFTAAAPVFNLTGCGDLFTQYSFDTLSTGCGASAVIKVHFQKTALCGACVKFSATLTVQDQVSPVILNGPAQITLNCDSPENAALLAEWAQNTVAANDPSGVTITHSALVTGAPGEPTTVLFTATDACGNTATTTGTITTFDFNAPQFTFVPANATIVCPATPQFGTPTATDACSAFTIAHSDQQSGGDCTSGYSVTRVWTATDAFGNSATASATIVVIPQTLVPPTFTVVPASDTIDFGMPVVFGQPQTSSSCTAGPVNLTFIDEVIGDDCAGKVHTRTWTVTDGCGQSATAAQSITVLPDTEAPQFQSIIGSVVLGQSEFANWLEDIANLAVDNSGQYTSNFETDSVDLCHTVVTWSVADACANTAEQTIAITWNEGPCAPSSVAEQMSTPASLTVYPNPANQWLHLRWAVDETVGVQIFDAYGRMIQSFEMNGQDAVNTSALPSGNWMMAVRSGKEVYHATFIINRQ